MGSVLASSMCFLCFNTEEMYLLHWHHSINVRLILVSLSFFSPCSASLDVFPKEDKVVRIHAFFSMLWYTVFFFVNLIKWQLHIILSITTFHNSVLPLAGGAHPSFSWKWNWDEHPRTQQNFTFVYQVWGDWIHGNSEILL